MAIDWTILEWIQSWHMSASDVVMTTVSRIGNGGLVWILLAAGLLTYPKTRKVGLAVAIALVLDLLICNGIIKPLVGRLRPFEINTGVALLIPEPSGFSFPSGHTTAAFSAAVALWFQKSRWFVPALLLACLMGFSRLYLYVHFPSDVLGGILLGIALGAMGSLAADKIMAWRKSLL